MLNIPDRINSRYRRGKKKSLATETFKNETRRDKKTKRGNYNISELSSPQRDDSEKYLRNKD